jgi:O-antigen ligase
VGLNNFKQYHADYSRVELSDYIVNGSIRFDNSSLEGLNTRSAHNSYIQILAETGIVGLSLYLLPLVILFVFYTKYFFRVKNIYFLDLLIIGVFLVSFHNWTISSYSSAISFALFGLGYGRMVELKNKLKI